MKDVLDKVQETIGLSRAEQEKARAVHRKSGARAAEYLVHRGEMSDKELIEFLCDQLKIERYTPESFPCTPAVKVELPIDVAMKYNVVPLRRDKDRLWIGTATPTDVNVLESLERLLGIEVEPVYAEIGQLEELLRTCYGVGSDARKLFEAYSEIRPGAPGSPSPEASRPIRPAPGGDTAENLVRQILAEAIRERASHIHITPRRNTFELHFRIGRTLKELIFQNKAALPPVISFLKRTAGMDLTTAKTPQSGAFLFTADNLDVNVKTFSIPTTKGESVVLRLFARNGTGTLRLEQVGLTPEAESVVKTAMTRPYGLILVSGPDGCGKTTLLYAMISHLDALDFRIFTLEDPVVSDIDSINQVQFNPKSEMSFAAHTQALIAQNPDLIMLGDLRDKPTASLTFQAVARGIKALTTVHAFSAAGAIGRLLELGAEPYDIASGLRLSINLRLVPRICPDCAVPVEPPQELLRDLPQDILDGAAFRQGTGCKACQGVGTRGKVGIYEILSLNESTRELILKRATYLEIARAAQASGALQTLAADALGKAASGLITLESALSLV